jgi:hypothetical protein
VKENAIQQLHRPALEIVEDVLTNSDPTAKFHLPKQKLLKRTANRCRAHLRPKEPQTLDFEVQ